MTRKNQSITLSIRDTDKEALNSIALQFGKTWGDKPNISKLVEAIARNELRIIVNHDWEPQRIETLEIARKMLLDQGYIAEAKEIAKILLERSELTLPFRAEIEKFTNKPLPTWRKQIEGFIKREQPFRLTYQDAAERVWNFTVLHGQLRLIEKHQYLVCTCDETEGNQDIPELKHNWTLRLDRIQEAVINPVNYPWQPNLDVITVEFKLLRGLAFAYAKGDPKLDDIFVSEIQGDPHERTIMRNVYSTFWFFREIASYWDECVIIAPESVRDRFKGKIRLLIEQYNLTNSI